jgi:hypothetical protein
MHAPRLRAPHARAARACKAPVRKAFRTVGRFFRELSRSAASLSPDAAAASAAQLARSSAQCDAVCQDVQLPPWQRAREYLPHELLRCALHIDASRGSEPAYLYDSETDMARLLVCNSHGLLKCTLVEGTNTYGYKLALEDMPQGGHASQAAETASVPPLWDGVNAARERLLRLFDAVDALVPDMLDPRFALELRDLAQHAGALAAFAAYVPDSAWVHAPETWRPLGSARCVLPA